VGEGGGDKTKQHKTKFSIGTLCNINPALKYVTHDMKKNVNMASLWLVNFTTAV